MYLVKHELILKDDSLYAKEQTENNQTSCLIGAFDQNSTVAVYVPYLPPTYEVQREVMFCLLTGGEGGYPSV